MAGAQYGVGLMYHKGQGTAKNYNEALRWYRKAAAQGNVRALNNIGYLYEYGYGVRRNLDDAAYYYRRASEKGYSVAGENLRRLGR